MDDLAIGRSIRLTRIRRGWRQEDLALAAGVSRATVSRAELGAFDGMPLGMLRRVCRAAGLRLTLEARGSGADLDRLLGAKHSAMHEGIAALFERLPDWVNVPEATFAIWGERGAIDVLAWHARTRSLLVIELKTELVDLQETIGTLDRKVRLAAKVAEDRGWRPATVSAWLVIAEGAPNRRRVAAHSALLRAAYPQDGRTITRWLRAPAGRVLAMSFLADARQGSTPSGFAAVNRIATPRTGPSAASR
jgi:transcriptional regulator with XRE-family HTH domain